LATITKRKHGYCVQIRRKGFAPVSRTVPFHAEAVAWASTEDARRTSSRPIGTIGDLKRTTVRDILERYLREVSTKNRGHEIECYQLAKVLRSPLAEMSLQKLSANALPLLILSARRNYSVASLAPRQAELLDAQFALHQSKAALSTRGTVRWADADHVIQTSNPLLVEAVVAEMIRSLPSRSSQGKASHTSSNDGAAFSAM